MRQFRLCPRLSPHLFTRLAALCLVPLLLGLAHSASRGEQPASPPGRSTTKALREAPDQVAGTPLIVFPIGRTERGRAIEAWIRPGGGGDEEGDKLRLLLVGESQAAAGLIREAVQRFYAADHDSPERKAMLVTAVPQMLPGLPSDTGAGFPPKGTAYSEPLGGASHCLWRWIGLHAPDLVVVLRDAPSETSWFVPAADFPGWNGLRKTLRPSSQGRDEELCAALVSHSACDTGRIPALRGNMAPKDAPRLLTDLLAALRQADFAGPSPARAVLEQRARRTPGEVAKQLRRHYGHELRQVVYIPALALVGRLRLAELTEDRQTLPDVERIVAPYFQGERDSTPQNGSALSGHLIFAELAARSQGTRRERYIELTRRAADLAFDAEGRPRPSMPFHSEMSDSLFMGGPILAEAGRLTGETRFYEACLRHLRFMRDLVLRDDGLYRHSPLDEAAWGRGNGFPALGLAWCLSCWPEERTDREELLKMFREHMAVLAEKQDATGCWHQVIDRADSYRELSSTCMITFALARGIRHGWLDRETYSPHVEKAWRAIRLRVAEDGGLVDVCTGTGKQPTLQAYYHRPAILGPDARGGAMALLAATEMMRLQDDAGQQ